MDQHLFEKWFKRHFLRYAPPVRPLLILLDGHTSHYSPEAITMAAEEQLGAVICPASKYYPLICMGGKHCPAAFTHVTMVIWVFAEDVMVNAFFCSFFMNCL